MRTTALALATLMFLVPFALIPSATAHLPPAPSPNCGPSPTHDYILGGSIDIKIAGHLRGLGFIQAFNACIQPGPPESILCIVQINDWDGDTQPDYDINGDTIPDYTPIDTDGDTVGDTPPDEICTPSQTDIGIQGDGDFEFGIGGAILNASHHNSGVYGVSSVPNAYYSVGVDCQNSYPANCDGIAEGGNSNDCLDNPKPTNTGPNAGCTAGLSPDIGVFVGCAILHNDDGDIGTHGVLIDLDPNGDGIPDDAAIDPNGDFTVHTTPPSPGSLRVPAAGCAIYGHVSTTFLVDEIDVERPVTVTIARNSTNVVTVSTTAGLECDHPIPIGAETAAVNTGSITVECKQITCFNPTVFVAVGQGGVGAVKGDSECGAAKASCQAAKGAQCNNAGVGLGKPFVCRATWNTIASWIVVCQAFGWVDSKK